MTAEAVQASALLSDNSPESTAIALRDAIARFDELRTADLRGFDKLRETDDSNLRLEMQRIRDEVLLRSAYGDKLIEAAALHVHEVEAKCLAATAALRAEFTNAMVAREVALTKAENASERRFDSVNEFRGQLSDQVATFVTKATVEALQATIAIKIDSVMDSFRAELLSRDAKIDALNKQVNFGLGVLAAIQVLVTIFLTLLKLFVPGA